MPKEAIVEVVKSDGSKMAWKVDDDKADKVIKILVTPPRKPYSRENAANWQKRGPKFKYPIEGEVLEKAIAMRADGIGKEEIARELKVSSRSLGRVFERLDQ